MSMSKIKIKRTASDSTRFQEARGLWRLTRHTDTKACISSVVFVPLCEASRPVPGSGLRQS